MNCDQLTGYVDGSIIKDIVISVALKKKKVQYNLNVFDIKIIL